MANITTGKFYYNKIWVIESIPKREKQTGSTLYRDLLKRRVEQEAPLTCELVTVNSKRNLIRFLKRVEQLVQRKNQLPFLHFEMHGARTGLALASGEIITWADLANCLRNINIETRNNLIVSLAACYGGRMFTEISPFLEAPFCGIVGPLMEVYVGDIEEGFNDFFESLLSGDEFEKAVLLLNNSESEAPKFHFVPAESIFNTLKRNHQLQYDDSTFLRNKIYELTDRALKNRSIRNSRSIWDIKASIEDFLVNGTDAYFDNMKDIFMMKNLPPIF